MYVEVCVCLVLCTGKMEGDGARQIRCGDARVLRAVMGRKGDSWLGLATTAFEK